MSLNRQWMMLSGIFFTTSFANSLLCVGNFFKITFRTVEAFFGNAAESRFSYLFMMRSLSLFMSLFEIFLLVNSSITSFWVSFGRVLLPLPSLVRGAS